MLTTLDWLTLEVKYLDPALSFYTSHLDLSVVDKTKARATLDAGSTELRLQTPSSIPRGGLHTHFAFSAPAHEYDEWLHRLDDHVEITEHEFGEYKSLYFYDPDNHCVEIGQRDQCGNGITGIFEVVFEVEDLDRAESFYTTLGGAVMSRGDDRARIRLDLGPVDLELWEPQLGIADAQGGVHVDVGFGTSEAPETVEAKLGEFQCDIAPHPGGLRIRDPDGHYLTLATKDPS